MFQIDSKSKPAYHLKMLPRGAHETRRGHICVLCMMQGIKKKKKPLTNHHCPYVAVSNSADNQLNLEIAPAIGTYGHQVAGETCVPVKEAKCAQRISEIK